MDNNNPVDKNGNTAHSTVIEEPAAIVEPVAEVVASTKAIPDVEQSKIKKQETEQITFNLHTGSLSELEREMNSNPGLFKEEDLNDPNSLAVKLVKIFRSGVYTASTEMMNVLLEKVNKEDIEIAKHKVSNGGSKFNGVGLRGSQAELAFTAKLKGLKKVYLYNSGFNIVIRPWSISELSMFFQSIDGDDSELGRLLGTYRFTIHDAFIKQKFMEILPTAIVSCNLKGWANGKTLQKHISFNDYDLLLWAVCSMMYKHPIKLDVKCLSCKKDSDSEYDISKMLLLNNSVINASSYEFIHKEEDVTPEQILEYKKGLNNFRSSMEHKIGDTVVKYSLAVPSIGEYLDNASKTIASLIAASQDVNDVKNRNLMNNIIIDFNKNYIPWIDELSIIENDKVVTSTSDKTAYPKILEMLGNDDSNSGIHDKLLDFIRDSNGVIVGYIPPKCPHCGKQYETKSGYLSWDVERLFFDLTYQALLSMDLSLS